MRLPASHQTTHTVSYGVSHRRLQPASGAASAALARGEQVLHVAADRQVDDRRDPPVDYCVLGLGVLAGELEDAVVPAERAVHSVGEVLDELDDLVALADVVARRNEERAQG